ncbi:MAG TPA: HEAT repeat domain-containing protein [Syntrophomonadaceae bacterium]|nr:HEAT repeat domain-containing protein [Syntrophomonadaceae bacterium]
MKEKPTSFISFIRDLELCIFESKSSTYIIAMQDKFDNAGIPIQRNDEYAAPDTIIKWLTQYPEDDPRICTPKTKNTFKALFSAQDHLPKSLNKRNEIRRFCQKFIDDNVCKSLEVKWGINSDDYLKELVKISIDNVAKGYRKSPGKLYVTQELIDQIKTQVVEQRKEDDPYIPPEIEIRIESSNNKEEYEYHSESIERIKESKKDFILIAECGMGKSAFLKYLGRSLLPTHGLPKTIPILIHAKDLASVSNTDEFINKLDEQGLDLNGYHLKDQEVLFLIDGFDQLPSNDAYNHINEILRSKKIINLGMTNRYLVVMRPTYVNRLHFDEAKVELVRLVPFDDSRIKNYLMEFSDDENIGNLLKKQRPLMQTPILLKLIKNLAVQKNLVDIKSRFDLYRRFVTHLYKEWENYKKSASYSDWEGVLLDISKVSYNAMRDRYLGYIPYRDLSRYLNNDDYKIKRLEEWCVTHDIMENGHKSALFYSHQSFQEYFASLELYYLLSMDNHSEHFVLEHLEYMHWDEIWALIQDRLDEVRSGNNNEDFRSAMRVESALENGTASLKKVLDNFPLLYAELLAPVQPVQVIKKLSANHIHIKNIAKIKYTNVIPYLIELLSSNNSKMVINIIETLGELKNPSAIPYLTKKMKENNKYSKIATAKALGEIGDSSAVPYLIESLQDKRPDVRSVSAKALGQIKSIDAIPFLLKILDDKDENVQHEVAKALGKLNEPTIMAHLVNRLRNDDIKIRYYAVKLLEEIGDPLALPYLFERLKYDDMVIRLQAALAISTIKAEYLPSYYLADMKNEKHGVPILKEFMSINTLVPYLIDKLNDSDEIVRGNIVEILGKMQNSTIIPYIMESLKDKKEYVRFKALKAFNESVDPSSTPYLTANINHDDEYVCMAIVEAFGRIRSKDAVPLLVKKLKDSHKCVRKKAAEALGEIKDLSSVPNLIDCLNDNNEDEDVRATSAESLGSMEALTAVPSLIACLNNKNENIVLKAVIALREIKDSTAVPPLFKCLQSKNEAIRNESKNAIIKCADSTSIPYLMEQLKNENIYSCCAVIASLGKLKALTAFPILIIKLKDPNQYIRSAAVEALGEIEDSRAVPDLINCLNDKNHEVRWKSAEALGKVKNVDAVQHLLKNLKSDTNMYVRKKAAWALGIIGDPIAVPLLIEMLKDQDEYFRYEVIKALGEIKDSTVISYLMESLKSSIKSTRFAAKRALEKFRDPSAVPYFIKSLKDDNEYIRREASAALGEIKDVRAVPHLIKLLKDYREINALTALAKIGSKSAIKIMWDELCYTSQRQYEDYLVEYIRSSETRYVSTFTSR